MYGVFAIMLAAGSTGLAGAQASCLYADMSPAQLNDAIKRCPVACVPAGIAEWHGEQSACGLDALKAESLCRMAAERFGGVCFPTVWTGPGGSTPFDPAKYPRGTLTIERELYDTAVEQLLTRIESMGFKVTVYLSGHYPGVIEAVAKKFNERGRMKVISVSENQVVEGMPAGDHAAAWETAVLMVLRPGLVDITRLPPLPAGARHMGDAIPPPWPFGQRHEYYGIYGADPRIWANRLFGRRGVEAVLTGLARRVREALGDDAYGRTQAEIRWPDAASYQDDPRYDMQLPYQWIQRFRNAPVVYWPLPTAGESIDAAAERACALALKTGGMVFPPFTYAPCTQAGAVTVSADVFHRIATEVVDTLAGMGFRVICLLPGAGMDSAALARLNELKPRSDQYQVVVPARETLDRDKLPASLATAISAMVPADARTVKLTGPWSVNEHWTIADLVEDIYGAGDVRVCQHAFELAEDDAKRHALLDLGDVWNLAQVELNDSPAISDHGPPYRYVVTGRLKPGRNQLKITVRHQPQPTLDPWYYRPGLPRLRGPVELRLWSTRP